jgi:rod shape-determining protein MreC
MVLTVAFGLSREQQNQVEALVRGTILYPFIELHRFSSELTQVSQRASDLQGERDSLVVLLSRYWSLANQADLFRTKSGLESFQLGSVRSAEVYPGRPRVGDPNVFVLKGPRVAQSDFPLGVFTGRGLVGVARGPHGRGARGEFWSHPDFRVSVVTEDGEVRGIVRAFRLDGGQAVLVLDGAPFQSNVRNGTLLMTTGIAGVYPPGVVVGTVRRVLDTEVGWMKSYILEPAVRPEEASIVLIWERPRLLEKSVTHPPLRSVDSNGTLRP